MTKDSKVEEGPLWLHSPEVVLALANSLSREGDQELAYALLRDWQYNKCLTTEELKEYARIEQARVAKAKRKAKAAGIELWSALLAPHASVAAIVDIEAALKHAGQWGRPMNDWSDSTADDDIAVAVAGRWSVRNSKGEQRYLDVKDALRARHACCRNREVLAKLFAVAIRHDWAPPGFAGVERLNAVGWQRLEAGLVWLEAVPGAHPWKNKVAVGAARFLARVPAHLRWSLLPQSGRRELTLRTLNWSRYRLARKNASARLAAMPDTARWKHLVGFEAPRGLELFSLQKFRVGTLLKLFPDAGLGVAAGQLKASAGVSEAGQLGALCNLVRLFGAEGAVRQFVKASGFMWNPQGIHDAGQFNLAKAGWTSGRWSALCLRHPGAVRFAMQFATLEDKGVFPQTLAELRRAVMQLDYPDIKPGFEGLAELCHAEGLDGATFETYQKFWARVKVKPAEFLPFVEVRGEDLSEPAAGWRFFRLASDDFRGPMLGELTGCCQHLNGAGSACARHGVVSPFSAFYVVTHGEKVIAQSWAWLSQSGHIVFDSIESRIREASRLEIAFRLIRAGARKLVESPFGIRGVYLGDTDYGATAEARAFYYGEKVPTTAAKTPIDVCEYYDGPNHTLLEGTARGPSRKSPTVEGYDVVHGKKLKRVLDVVGHYALQNPEEWFFEYNNDAPAYGAFLHAIE